MANNDEDMFNRELGQARIAPTVALETSAQAARKIKIIHHSSCFVALVSRLACKFFAVIFLTNSQLCVQTNQGSICVSPSNVDVLGAELSSLLTRVNTVSWFEIAIMSIGHTALLGSLICVPEEKLSHRTLFVISLLVIVTNVVFGSVMLVTLSELERHPEVEVNSIAHILLAICLALTPFLYYCPSKEYREIVRRAY